MLTSTSIDAQNYLDLEEKIKVLEWSLANSENFLAIAKKELQNQADLSAKELKDKETTIARLEQRVKNNSLLISNYQKEMRENQLYYQRSLRTSTQDLKEQLAKIKKELANTQKELTQWQGESKDSLRELKARAKLITDFQEKFNENKQQLDLANSKSKQLKLLFSQIIATVNKGLFIKKKDLKETLGQIQELMQWEGMASVAGTTSATPNPEE